MLVTLWIHLFVVGGADGWWRDHSELLICPNPNPVGSSLGPVHAQMLEMKNVALAYLYFMTCTHTTNKRLDVYFRNIVTSFKSCKISNTAAPLLKQVQM